MVHFLFRRERLRKTPYPPRTDGKPDSEGRRGAGGYRRHFRHSRRQAAFRHLYLGNLELRGYLRENFHGGGECFPKERRCCGGAVSVERQTDQENEETERFHLSHNAMGGRLQSPGRRCL